MKESSRHATLTPSFFPSSLPPSLPSSLPTLGLVAQRPPLLIFEVLHEAFSLRTYFPALSWAEQKEGVVRQAPDEGGQEGRRCTDVHGSEGV